MSFIVANEKNIRFFKSRPTGIEQHSAHLCTANFPTDLLIETFKHNVAHFVSNYVEGHNCSLFSDRGQPSNGPCLQDKTKSWIFEVVKII